MASLAKKPAPGKAAPSVQVGLLDILVSDRLRVLRPEVVNEIAESFGTLGQLQAIVVRQVKALQSFRSSYEDLHDIAKKTAPKKPATKKAAGSIGNAIAKGIDATPPAEEFPDLPAALDRRPKPQTTETVDDEAAEIAARASREKKWLLN